MVNGLPDLPYADRIKKHTLDKFRGYNHTLAAADGELYEMTNMSADFYPLLAPRGPRRYYDGAVMSAYTFAAGDLYYISGSGFYKRGSTTLLGSVSSGEKQLVKFQSKIIIMPDKKYYDTASGVFGSLEASWRGTVEFASGIFAGQPAEGCAIKTASGVFPFTVGDAVTVSGCSLAANNLTAIVREIQDNGRTLVFYENTWTVGSASNVTLARPMPDLQFVCENENRLWGCAGNTIYASKLGDPTNWQVFDGLATDSFAVGVGSAGAFTGCVAYLDYPTFFKEDSIYKIYGTKPSNFKLMGTLQTLGVAAGSSRSLAVAGDILFYLSPAGVIAYSGGQPNNIASPFGITHYKNAVGGSDGVKYYISMVDDTGSQHLFVFDTRLSVWHREDAFKALMMETYGGAWALDNTGRLQLLGRAGEPPIWTKAESSVAIPSEAVFADLVESDPNKKGIAKIQLRLELEAGASVVVSLLFDSGTTWEAVARLTAAHKRSYYLPIIPRRTDHFKIKLTGTGMWRLYSLTRESYSGSEL